ncbi:hypothetical protein PPACK8108_LOCUS4492 [Phakopsora pachyrhizi]|uniref:Uncharacterized protein n=1 Tax=Phakopsora pachyrhizi TaxID=170000 RepID=A0AAV0AM24_PHAPC|nr:hypothetical protein PPACK8108_LOCUS4492 [Phakopsora pachyrhizi]
MLIGRIPSTPNGGDGTDWATQINQDLTVVEKLVRFVETDGVSSEESSPACGTEELVSINLNNELSTINPINLFLSSLYL